MKKIIAIAGILVLITILSLAVVPYVMNVTSIPQELYLYPGNSKTINFNLPFSATISQDKMGILKMNGNNIDDKTVYNLGEPITIEPVSQGTASLSFEVMGLSIKTVKVTVDNEKKVIPGGQSIGVMLYTNGALVVGGSDIVDPNGKTVNPAKEAGLKSGDVIEKINGIEIKNADHLSQLVNEVTGDIDLTIKRANKTMHITIRPVQDSDDKKYRLGVWVRDSTAGVGTLTFYDPSIKKYAGLGHPITDADTGERLSVKNGEIIASDIIEISKGISGEPGELKGYFNVSHNKIGSIEKNTRFGIYGAAYSEMEKLPLSEAVTVMSRNEVKEGKATIYSTIDDKGVEPYECEIIKINRQDTPDDRSFVVKITDKTLLDRTGGIVQGMSGSPVLQDGKIVGAVTHVFINDPTKGYGIYCDWMLEEMYKDK